METHRIPSVIFIVGLVIFNILGTYAEESNVTPREPRIIIIGAGPSGIAAASKLFENGFKNVTILEAEDRIGGRVYTTKFGPYSVDLGGQWVYGQGDNPSYKLAKPLDLLDGVENDDPNGGLEQEFVDSKGNPLNPELTKKVEDFFFTKVFGSVFNDTKDEPKYESLGQYVLEKFDEEFKDEPEILKDRNMYLHHLEVMEISSDAAMTWFDVSPLTSTQFYDWPGNLMTNWKERGYSTLLEILMKRIPDPTKELPVLNNTILNTEVVSIDYSSGNKELPILINTANGQVYKADHVIVTVSLGVLKEKHKSLFIPPLSDEKVSTIEAHGFGNIDKIIFMFDKLFWERVDPPVLNLPFLWKDEDRKVIEADPERQWLLGITGATRVEHKPNLLLLWVVGNYSKTMEAQSEDKVFKYAVENLHRFLGKSHNVTEPVAMLRTRWSSNPHFKGVYSYWSVESQKRKVSSETLEKPVSEETLKILFAGEATSPHRFGTVDGAISTGWKAADRLINRYKKS